MDIGDPTIYKCPLCGKKMQMTNFTSYTVSSSSYFSDGFVKHSGICCPIFTPDIVKCPHCGKLFFRHNVKDAETVNFYENNVKESVEDPEREDLIDAVKNKIYKNRQEERELREMLLHELNIDTRQGYDELKGDLLKIWLDNCAVLLGITEKTFEEMRSKKNSEKYKQDDMDSCLFMTAELNRNLGKFDKCMEIFKELGGKWTWVRKQFEWECKAKNIFTFELLSKKEMNLDKNKNACDEDFFERAKKFLPPYYGRRNLKKVIDDLKKAEDLGMKGVSFYRARADIYLEEINDPDSAIADYNKALKQKDIDRFNTGYISGILIKRSRAYQKKGNFKKALCEMQNAIDKDEKNDRLYAARSEIYEAMGDVKAAQNDKKKAEALIKKRDEEWEAIKRKPVKVISNRKRKGSISEL